VSRRRRLRTRTAPSLARAQPAHGAGR
jgi:hypothetical protein